MRVFASLGSNVGDRLSLLRAAADALAAEPGISLVAASDVYETEPVGPDQPDFLNAAVELDSQLPPSELLRRFKAIEARLGRVPRERWGQREIDIDLLLYGDLRIDEPDLRVPHVGLVSRAFVLVPLADIAGDCEIPGGGTVDEALLRVDRSGVRATGGRLR